MVSSKTLAEATVQEIQLELIRRTQHNFFHGEKVVNDLLAHREWWEAVLMDTCNLPQNIPGGSLIKLRDLKLNLWNVDTLYILAPDEKSARQLAGLGKVWQADSVTIYDEKDTDRLLGGGGMGRRLVVMWWD